ncbi:MAG: hypothetical protein M1834_008099 [Cirrosporium novae-zelandiae]|nr:MAG: hypothetical protein M1834_008099 [Cirrosporium novae-zelandiae]
MEALQDIFTTLANNGTLPQNISPLSILPFLSVPSSFLSKIPALPSELPDLSSIVLTLLAIFLALKILGMAVRTVWGWALFIFRLAFWGSLVVVGIWVYIRGLETTANDLGWIWGLVNQSIKEEEKRIREFQVEEMFQQQPRPPMAQP